VSVLPLVVQEKSSLLQIFFELIAFSLGIFMMVVVAVLEEHGEEK
jgi:hypothetical protein